MNNLLKPWQESDVIAVGGALRSLFICQGITKSDEGLEEMTRTFCQELENKDIPSKAVVAGINKLKTDDLRGVKLLHVIEASRGFIEQDTTEKTDCEFCNRRGVVLMRDGKHYEHALACTCSNGDSFRLQGYASWNGQKYQDRKGRVLELRFAEFAEVA